MYSYHFVKALIFISAKQQRKKFNAVKFRALLRAIAKTFHESGNSTSPTGP